MTNGRARTCKQTPTIEWLAELAGPGPVLELGIGTGRATVPLAARGLAVHGIEASEKMVQRLREKPGGDRVQVTIGDIADTDVEGTFSLILAIGDTLSMLPTQEQQRRCLERFGGKLADAGSLVVEGIVSNVAPEGTGPRAERQRERGASRRREGRSRDPGATVRARDPQCGRHADHSRPRSSPSARRARSDGLTRWSPPPREVGRLGAATIHRPKSAACVYLRARRVIAPPSAPAFRMTPEGLSRRESSTG